jgi:peptide deformylase
MGHETLKQVAEPVADPTDVAVAALARDMRDTLEAIDATGIAAPQVGESRRLVVYRLPESRIPEGAKQEPVPWTVLVNPVLEPVGSGQQMMWERCLSLPGLYGRVPRFGQVRLRYRALDGSEHERLARGYHASLLQHECDHLDGVLYPMRMRDMGEFGFASEINAGGALYRYSPAEFDGEASTA